MIVLAIIGLLLFFPISKKWGDQYGGLSGFQVFAIFVWVVVGLMIGGYAVGALIPADPKYHSIYRMEGHISTVSNTISEDGGKFTRKTVLKMAEHDELVETDDPRLVTMLDKNVLLTCTVNWQMYGLDKIDCDLAGVK